MLSVKVAASQTAKVGTLRCAERTSAVLLPEVRPNTTTVTTGERPRCSARSQTAKVKTNWKITAVGASSIRPISHEIGHTNTQPTATLPKTVSRKVGRTPAALKPPPVKG